MVTGKIEKPMTPIPFDKTPVRSEMTGFFRDVDDTATSYIGEAGKGTLRIYNSGKLTKVLREPNVQGVIYKTNIPEITESEGNTIFNVGKKGLTTETKQDLTKTVGTIASSAQKEGIKAIVKPLEKLPSIRATGTTLATIQITQSAKPIQSLYYGQGTYEKTNEQATNNILSGQQIKLIDNTKPKVETIVGGQNKLKDNIINIPRQEIKPDEIQKPKEVVIPATKLKQEQTQKRKVISKFGISPNLKLPIVTSKSKLGGLLTGSKINLSLKNAYDIFIRRKGKEVRIGEGLPIGKATKLGVSRNLRDLSASFKLSQRGSTSQEDINFNIPANLFRPSKREAGRIVQRRASRLGARTEISEILSAKRVRKIGRLKLF